MGGSLGAVVIYQPPQDGLPYVVVVIVDDDPQLVGFESTAEEAAATAKAMGDRLWSSYELSVS